MSLAEDHSVAVTSDAGRTTIIIERPGVRNAINLEIADTIIEAVKLACDDSDCGVVILAGSGGDLSSGADRREPEDPGAGPGQSATARLLRSVFDCPLPVISVLDGWAVGLGVGLLGAATYAVAGDGSRLRLPEAELGFFPYLVAPYVAERVRRDIVARWALAPADIELDEAFAAGLITHTASAGEALSEAHVLADQLLAAGSGPRGDAMRWLHRTRDQDGGIRAELAWCEREHYSGILVRRGGDMSAHVHRAGPRQAWASLDGLVKLSSFGPFPATPEDLLTRAQIESLFHRFAIAHDESRTELVAECFTDDGSIRVSSGSAEMIDQMQGRTEIRDHLSGVVASHGEQRRHFITNVMILRQGEGEATAIAYGLVPTTVERVEIVTSVIYRAEVQRGDDGQWLFKMLHIGMDGGA